MRNGYSVSFRGKSLVKQLIAALLIIIPSLSMAQKQGNNWFFGAHCGLDFKGGNPAFVAGGQTYYVACPGCVVEATASISDSSGDLLFYTDGSTIWNKNQKVMPNGSGILSNASASSMLIVPQPGSSRLFYLFTPDEWSLDGLKYGFRYSVVDMCLDNGLGDVLIGQKNILLLDTVAEKVTAVRHSNGVDYWIITHKYESDAFYSYLLTATGITDTVITHIGSTHPNFFAGPGTPAAIGQLKASPDGKKLAIASGNSQYNIAEYFDFDNSTGKVSNWVNLNQNRAFMNYGVSFSPDNSKLYIGTYLAGFNFNGIYQFDLSAGGGNPDSVRASAYKFGNVLANFGIQLANNGKIYVGCSPYTYLAVINDPNKKGKDCNYVANGVYLNGLQSSYGLPNFIDSYDYSNGVLPGVTISSFPSGLICPGTTVQFNATATNATALTYEWFVNGVSKQTGTSPVYTNNAFIDSDVVSCVITTNGCPATSNLITITTGNPKTGVIGTPQDTICAGMTVNLALTGTTITPIQWQSATVPGNFTDVNGADTLTYASNPLNQTTYFRVVGGTGTCRDTSAVFRVVAVPLPLAGVISATADTVCKGTQANLTVTGNKGNSIQWQWTTTPVYFIDLTGVHGATYTTSPLNYTTYFRIITSRGACADTSAIFPVAVVSSSSSTTIAPVLDTACEGSSRSVSITGAATGPFQWQSAVTPGNFTNVIDATASDYTSLPLGQSTYFRVITGIGTCTDTSNISKIFVPKPLLSLYTNTKAGYVVNFNSDSSAGDIISYSWNFGDNTISTLKNPVHTYSAAGTFNACLTIYDGSNCSYTYCKDVVVGPDGISSLVGTGKWSIYPDPFSDYLLISGKNVNVKVRTIEIYDVLGRTLLSKELNRILTGDLWMDVSGFAQGVYYLKIKTSQTEEVYPIVKQ